MLRVHDVNEVNQSIKVFKEFIKLMLKNILAQME